MSFPFFVDDQSTQLAQAADAIRIGKFAICRGCQRNYRKKTGVKGRYCSNKCKQELKRTKEKCQPKCADETLSVVEVTFKNGSTHLRLGCRICTFYRFVPKREKTQAEQNIKRAYKRLPKKFYFSREWLELRYQVIKNNEGRCMACHDAGSQLHVDHIKPKSLYPDLALRIDNLQILCKRCNMGKSNKDETDWRKG